MVCKFLKPYVFASSIVTTLICVLALMLVVQVNTVSGASDLIIEGEWNITDRSGQPLSSMSFLVEPLNKATEDPLGSLGEYSDYLESDGSFRFTIDDSDNPGNDGVLIRLYAYVKYSDDDKILVGDENADFEPYSDVNRSQAYSYDHQWVVYNPGGGYEYIGPESITGNDKIPWCIKDDL